MALTPTQESVAIAIGNAFIAAGFTTEAAATAMLKRLKLEQDLRKLQTAETGLRNQYGTATTQYSDALAANQALQNAKVDEINALLV